MTRRTWLQRLRLTGVDLDSTSGNAAKYVLERVVRLLLAVVVGALVARYLGPQRFGAMNYVLSIFSILGPLSHLGMTTILVRDFSTGRHVSATYVSAMAVQAIGALIASISGAALVVGTRGLTGDSLILALAAMPIPIVGISITSQSHLEASGDARTVVRAGLLAGLAAAILRVSAIAAGAPVAVFVLFVSVELGLRWLLLLIPVSADTRSQSGGESAGEWWKIIRLRLDWLRGKELLAESWPLLLSGFAVGVFMKADVLMIGLLVNDDEVGLYSAAARVSEVWYFLPVAAMSAVRPAMSRLLGLGDIERYHRLTERWLSVFWVASLCGLVGIQFLAPQLIGILYGTDYVDATNVLRFHILAAPAVYLGVGSSQWFVDKRATRVVVFQTFGGASLNVLLNLILIPVYGAEGAAVSTAISYTYAWILANGVHRAARPLLKLQVRAMLFRDFRARSDE